MNINWYPGHMAKAKRIIKEKLKLVDIIFEVIDARMPYSSKIKDIDSLIKNKPKILIMTKIDLCDMKETSKWISYYETKGYNVIGVDLINNINVSKIILLVREVLSSITNKALETGMLKRPARALVLGIPNVGKSTLINRLVGKKATNVGDRPGITKSLDWIRVNEQLELLDSPGILWPRLDEGNVAYNLAALNAIKEELLPIDDVSVYVLKYLSIHYPESIKKRYNIDKIDFDNIIDTIDLIGKQRGCIIRGGEIDYKKVSSLILKDLNDGYLGLITFDIMNK